MKPVARKNGLVVQHDTGELFIQDLLNGKQIHLNPTSAYVWERCDGNKDPHQIASEMGSELGVAVSADVVLLALDQLDSESLLENAQYFP